MAENADYYVSTNGDDSNSGTKQRPFRTVQRAIDELQSGELAYIRGGTYNQTNGSPIFIDGKSGTEESPIRLEGFPNEDVHVQWEGAGSGGWSKDGGFIFRNGASYWELRNLEISDSPYMAINVPSRGCTNNTFDNLHIHNNGNAGMQVHGDGTVIRNVESNGNYDRSDNGNDADGIVVSSAVEATIQNCVSHHNSDDGFDLWDANSVTIKGCESHNNGRDNGDGNGFKLGGPASQSGEHFIVRNIAYDNRGNGFHYNQASRPMEVYQNTAYNNGNAGYMFQEAGHVLKNNIAYANSSSQSLASVVEHAHNTWNLGIGNPGFKSVDTSDESFLVPSSDSPVCNAGTEVGLSFQGEAPDLGAFEAQANAGVPVRYHDGSGWTEATVKHHNGDGWQESAIRHHDGAGFAGN